MQWIKASERLPDKLGYYHVKAVFDGVIYPEGAQYSPAHNMWGSGMDGNVIEWLSESSPPCQCERYREVLEKYFELMNKAETEQHFDHLLNELDWNNKAKALLADGGKEGD